MFPCRAAHASRAVQLKPFLPFSSHVCGLPLLVVLPPHCRQTAIAGCVSLPQWPAGSTAADWAGEGGRKDLRELCRYAFEVKRKVRW